MTGDTLVQQIADKKAELDQLRAQAPHGLVLRGSYPPVAVRPLDQTAYIDALQHEPPGTVVLQWQI
jgi:hypothetical protein